MKVLFLAPHLSTGGMPEFLRKRVEVLSKLENYELWVVEYAVYSDSYVTHKNKIIDLIEKDKFISLGWVSENESVALEKAEKLKDLVLRENFDIIHIESLVEKFDDFNKVSSVLLNFLYKSDRKWRIIETPHGNNYNSTFNKTFIPDGYAYCTEYHLTSEFDNLNKSSLAYNIEYPVTNKTTNKLSSPFQADGKINILNVGLWAPHKNQKEVLEIARKIEQLYPDKFNFHFIGNQASNFETYWGPLMQDLPPNVTVWRERSDVDRFYYNCDALIHLSLNELNPLVLKECLSYNKSLFLKNLDIYMNRYNSIAEFSTGRIVEDCLKLDLLTSSEVKYMNSFNSIQQEKNFAELHHRLYAEVLNRPSANFIKFQGKTPTVNIDVLDGLFCEIVGEDKFTYNVSLINDATGEICYYSTIKCNHWVKSSLEFYIPWKVVITSDNPDFETFEWKLDLNKKQVRIDFRSDSLGDNIAWIPVVELFRKTHNCTVICSTYYNFLFEKKYPNITFINPNEDLDEEVYSIYKIGWFYDKKNKPDLNRTRLDFSKLPLQKTASAILGLDHDELPCFIDSNLSTSKKPPFKYVTLSLQSTTQAKYWNFQGGWEKVIDWLNIQGLQVVCVDRYSSFGGNGILNTIPSNCIDMTGMKLQDTITLIKGAEFHLGISSGLSWLAWGLEKQVVLISGFTTAGTEFKSNCIRIGSQGDVCTGCFSKERLDQGDWLWCPYFRDDSERRFECSKSITPSVVINAIKESVNLS